MSWIDLFKVGTHTDSSGSSRQWSESDLKAIVDKYNNQSAENKHRAPAIAGQHHENENLAAYGWVKQLKYENGHLWGEFTELEPEFVKMVNNGRFGTVSIALYPNQVLRHVAFLGAVPPALKGLKTPKFSEATGTLLTYQIKKQIKQFSESKSMDIDEFIKALVDAVKATDGDEVATNIRAKAEELKGNFNKPSEAPKPEESKPSFSETPEGKRIKELEMKLYNQENSTFFSEMLKSGRLLPKQLPALETILNGTFNDSRKLQFSEGKSLSIGDAVKEFVRSLPENYSLFSETATENRVGGSMLDLDKFIEERRKR